MAADQVLSLEVVTEDGRFVTASPKPHPDLHWAECGGGGSAFGVVTSLTVKAYPKLTISTLTLSFSTELTVSDEAFWAGLKAYFDGFETYADKGNYGYLRIRNLGPGHAEDASSSITVYGLPLLIVLVVYFLQILPIGGSGCLNDSTVRTV